MDLTPCPSLEETKNIAKLWHGKQLDILGLPLYQHGIRVASNIKNFNPFICNDVLKVAILHEVMEDCSVSPAQLIDQGFNLFTIRLIQMMKAINQDQRPYHHVICDLVYQQNPNLILLKFADDQDSLETYARLGHNSRRIEREKQFLKSTRMMESALLMMIS